MTNFKEAAILCKSYTIDTKSNPYSKACYKLQLLNKILFVQTKFPCSKKTTLYFIAKKQFASKHKSQLALMYLYYTKIIQKCELSKYFPIFSRV